MKIRTDFVTNSSSSSFTLMIEFELIDAEKVCFLAHGGSGETGRVDYFADDAMVTVSPKQLGDAESVNELIKLLENGVKDGWDDDEIKIFEHSRPVKSAITGKKYDAYDFILEIQKKIKSMDQIRKITISGDEENDLCYNRSYTYDLKTKAYTGIEEGSVFEKHGSSGGDLNFEDLYSCTIDRGSASEEKEQNNYAWEDDYPIVKAIEGTGYEGRIARIEHVKIGDKLILKADYNSRFYSPVAIEVFNARNESLGYLTKGVFAGSLGEIASHLTEVEARVASVTPLSKRSKNAKYALMDVEIYIPGLNKKHPSNAVDEDLICNSQSCTHCVKSEEEEWAETICSAMKKYDEKMSIWEKNVETINLQRKKAVEDRLATETQKRSEEIDSNYKKSWDELTASRLKAEKSREEKQISLESFGIFDFSQKSAVKRQIRELTQQITTLEVILGWMQERRSQLEMEMAEKYPFPRRPIKPYAGIPQRNYMFGNSKITQEMMWDEEKKMEIAEEMTPGRLYSLNDFNREIEAVYHYGTWRIRPIINDMVGVSIERVTIEEETFYRLLE